MDETEYTDGAVVWVKLAGGKWWPGQVVARDTCPDDLLKGRKKEPVAIVKFFEEDALEVVKTPQHIHPFQGLRKNEFIRKGQEMSKVTDRWAGKFNVDVARAERLCALLVPVTVPENKDKDADKETDNDKDSDNDDDKIEDRNEEKEKKEPVNTTITSSTTAAAATTTAITAAANVNDFDLQEAIDEESEHQSDAGENGSASGDQNENSMASNHVMSTPNHKDTNCTFPSYSLSPTPHSNDSSSDVSRSHHHHTAHKMSLLESDMLLPEDDEEDEYFEVRIRLQPLGPSTEPTGHSCIHCSYQTRRMSNLLRHYKDHYRSGAALDGYQHLGLLTKRKAEKPKRTPKGPKVPRRKSAPGGDSEKKKKDVSAQTPKGRKRKSAAISGDASADATGNGSGPVPSTPATVPKKPKKKGESAFDQIRRGTVIPRANRRHRFLRGMAGDDRPHGSDSSDEEFLITRAVFGESSDSEEEEDEEEEDATKRIELDTLESVEKVEKEETKVASTDSEVDGKKVEDMPETRTVEDVVAEKEEEQPVEVRDVTAEDSAVAPAPVEVRDDPVEVEDKEDKEEEDNAIMAEALRLLGEKAPEVPGWAEEKKDIAVAEEDDSVVDVAKDDEAKADEAKGDEAKDDEVKEDEAKGSVVDAPVAFVVEEPAITPPEIQPSSAVEVPDAGVEEVPTASVEEEPATGSVVAPPSGEVEVPTEDVIEAVAPPSAVEVEVPEPMVVDEPSTDENEVPATDNDKVEVPVAEDVPEDVVTLEPMCPDIPDAPEQQVLMDVEDSSDGVTIIEKVEETGGTEEEPVVVAVEKSSVAKEVLEIVQEPEEIKLPEVIEETIPVAVEEEIQIVEEVKMDVIEVTSAEDVIPVPVVAEEEVGIIIEEVEETKAEVVVVERSVRGGRGRGAPRGGRLGPRGRFGRGAKLEPLRMEKAKPEPAKKTPRQEPKKVQFLTDKPDKPDAVRLLEPVIDMPSPRGGRGPLRVYTPRPKAVRDKEKAEELLKAKAAEQRLKQDEDDHQPDAELVVDEPKATEEEVLLEVVTAPEEEQTTVATAVATGPATKAKLTASVSSTLDSRSTFPDINPKTQVIQVVTVPPKKVVHHHLHQQQQHHHHHAEPKTIIELTPVAPIVMSSLQNMDMPCQVLTIDEMGEVQAVVESGTELMQVATEQVIETHMDDDIFCNEVVIDSEDKASQEGDEIEEVVCLVGGNNANNAEAPKLTNSSDPKSAVVGSGSSGDKESEAGKEKDAAKEKPVVVAGGPGDHIALFTGDPAREGEVAEVVADRVELNADNLPR